MKKAIFTIFRKELVSYLNASTTYVVLAGWLLLWEFFFFRSFFLVGEASLRNLFTIFPWFLIFIVPAFTMGSFSQEEKEGTLEIVLTKPISELSFVLGKFLAVFSLLSLGVLLTLIIPLTIGNFGQLEWGPVVTQYLGAILSIALMVGLGLLISSLTKNQILSLLASATIMFLLVISGQEAISSALPASVYQVINQLSLNSHLSSFGRGVLDARDLLYFVSVSAIFIAFSYLSLLRKRISPKAKSYRNLLIFALGVAAIAVLVNVSAWQIPGRVDLTSSRLYTLSSGTKDIIRNLGDIVSITLYSSQQLPAQVSPVVRGIEDILFDYKRIGGGKITIAVKHPDKDPAIEDEAISFGIRPLQFNVISQEEYQVKKGYLGLVVQYLDRKETIPVVQNTDDLEYQLTSLILKLTNDDKKKILFISGHGEKTTFADLSTFKKELTKQYMVQERNLDGEDSSIPEDAGILVLAGPTAEIPETVAEGIKEFVRQGGSLLALIDTVTVSTQSMSAYPNRYSGADIIRDFGVTVEENLVYDLGSNESVNLGGAFPVFVRYPLWLRAVPSGGDSFVTNGIRTVTLPWPSSLSWDDGVTPEVLLSTSPYGGIQSGTFDISPTQRFPDSELSVYNLVVSLKLDGGGRMVVVGDSDFLTENFVSDAPNNLKFALNVVDWLGQDESLSGIRAKTRLPSPLVFSSDQQMLAMKYGNMIAVGVLLLGFGVAWAIERRRRVRRKAASLV